MSLVGKSQKVALHLKNLKLLNAMSKTLISSYFGQKNKDRYPEWVDKI